MTGVEPATLILGIGAPPSLSMVEIESYEFQDMRARQNTSPAAPDDPDLARVVGSWSALPPAVRAGIVAMVAAAVDG